MNSSEIILYQADDGSRVRLRASGGTVWLTQAEMAGLYDTSVPNIAQIVRRVLADGEVTAETVNSELMVRTEGARRVRREIKVYNLDMILAVGYRVTTPRAVQFRQWATSVLREYLVKGFAMDDARLAEGSGQDYFDELLERIRAIRASEKRFYQKVRDFYATAVDYRADSDEARTFFAAVQNKMLWAVTGHTAAEIVALRSDPDAPVMGLTSWRGEVMRKGDVAVAKKYLDRDETKDLDQIVTMYLDYAETQARRRRTMTMAQWAERLDAFLQFNERELLTHAGTVCADVARALAEDRTSSTTRGGGRSTPRRRTCGACGSSSTGPTRRRMMEAMRHERPARRS
ncbi:toxin-antitoxin system, toxin component, Fic family [Propionibacterium acidifaciens F0233]|uniref:Toxin-antitoxin system, toxin component, Fic family n=1 Tax=Propionibacterium acidifaciens F0233 TaxID=553198 RepID=U2SDM9_9ACTN|nr:virulence RhuM family protein [Propionibacterium acidifaciens]ERK60817.1 toxin-antitoxin system, toxin component, Fic family [Propionibacterium acidifaciens F0233]